jgi:hypothetical protein
MFGQQRKEDVEALVTKLRKDLLLESMPSFHRKPLRQSAHYSRLRPRLCSACKVHRRDAIATAH